MLGRVIAGRLHRPRRALGAGSMGTVYRAKQTRMGREVAIEILRSDRALDEASRATLPARGARQQPARVAAHRHGLRLRRRRAAASSTSRWSCSRASPRAAHPRAWAASPRAAARYRAPSAPLARRGARQGDHPPRPQARQSLLRRASRTASTARRDREGPRLRRREDDPRRRRARDERRRDAGGHGLRDAAVHVARAGAGQAARHAQRPLLARASSSTRC